jgi:hypothetical protein
MTDLVRYETDGAVVTLTLNLPEQRRRALPLTVTV